MDNVIAISYTNMCNFLSNITNILKRDWFVKTIQIDGSKNDYANFLASVVTKLWKCCWNHELCSLHSWHWPLSM